MTIEDLADLPLLRKFSDIRYNMMAANITLFRFISNESSNAFKRFVKEVRKKDEDRNTQFQNPEEN